ncbi:MAG: hypothetical protein B5M52_05645 [Helicobacteraceae bacterium 4484_230]|nr:MAG: hypothetical protein B5M52_05645 [Helicobacteraceae bacterium 4484_230]
MSDYPALTPIQNTYRKRPMKYILLSSILIYLLGGCSTTVNIKALQPAEVDRAAFTKKIAVTPFQNDQVGLSSKIEARVASKKVDGKNYFTTISRRDIRKIIEEQKLQNSGLLDESTAVRLGKLLGAQAMISGNVTTASFSDTHYQATRTKCSDKKCKTTYEYNVPCTKRVVTLASQVRMVDVEKGDIIFADLLHRSRNWSHCSDDSSTIPSSAQALDLLSTELANAFAYKLTPHYVDYSVTLLDEPDLEYTDDQKKALENALVYIERSRYDKAERILSRLLEESMDQSYVAAYNLGVVKEVQGEYEESKSLYELADRLTHKPVEEIDTAMLRIRRSIEQREQAKRQIQQ